MIKDISYLTLKNQDELDVFLYLLRHHSLEVSGPEPRQHLGVHTNPDRKQGGVVLQILAGFERVSVTVIGTVSDPEMVDQVIQAWDGNEKTRQPAAREYREKMGTWNQRIADVNREEDRLYHQQLQAYKERIKSLPSHAEREGMRTHAESQMAPKRAAVEQQNRQEMDALAAVAFPILKDYRAWTEFSEAVKEMAPRHAEQLRPAQAPQPGQPSVDPSA